MKFKAKVWKQGKSKIITIPAHLAKQLKGGEKVNVEIERKVIMCKCGKIYQKDQKADHKCKYVEFESISHALSTKELFY